MNESLIGFLFSSVGSLSSVASLVVSLIQANRKDQAMLMKGKIDSCDATVNKEEVSWRWPFLLILLVTLVSFSWLVYGYVFTSLKVGRGVVVTFIISVMSLIVYAGKAYSSFEKHYILWPKKLWQGLFNKIPSHIEKADQLVFKFMVLKMEDSPEVVDAAERIKNNYKGREHDFQVVVKSYLQDAPIVVNRDYCGVIFIVGEECFRQQSEVEKVMDKFSKQLSLPIAYIILGEHYYRFEKYHRISDKYIEKNCANHLIMRGYRRSEHWISTSRYSHVALLAMAFLTITLLIGLVETKKTAVLQSETITQNDILLAQFGYDRSKIHLPNEFIRLKEASFDIEALQKDEIFKSFVDGFGPYVFGEVNVEHKMLLWLRNGLNDELVCIYDSGGNLWDNKSKDEGSIIGGIAKYAPIFVLWPGFNNVDTLIWNNPKFNTMAWTNEDKGAYASSELRKNSEGYNDALRLKKTNDAQPITLEWKLNNYNMNNSNAIALFGYSYDGRLAIELDFSPTELNNNTDMRIYIQNLLFRNCVRKFAACINSYLNCYGPKVKEV